MKLLYIFTTYIHKPLLLFLSIFYISSAFAGDRIPEPANWGDFFVYQKDNGDILIRVLASNDQGCNDVWDQLYIKYVTDDGTVHNLLYMDDNSCSGCSVFNDPNDYTQHYYKGLNGNNITKTAHQDENGGDLYLEFTWHNPPSNLRKKDNFYLTGLWRACWDDWIGDWRYDSQHNSPWMRTCHLLDGGLAGKYNPAKKKDILRYWAPRVFHDTMDAVFTADICPFWICINLYEYPIYWQQDIFGPVNFDGDWNTKNNWENNAGSKVVPQSYTYSSFVETTTHYFLGYQFFHPTDDAQVVPQDRHENDLEDVYICIEKGSANGGFGEFVAMATQAHGDYDLHLLGQVKMALGHHPQIYITSNGIGLGGDWDSDYGHSIYAYDGTYQRNFTDFPAHDGIVFNISDRADHLQSDPVMQGSLPTFGITTLYPVQAYYDLLDIDELWSLRETTNHDPFYKYGGFGGEGSNGKGPGAHAPWSPQSDNDHKIFYHPAEYFNTKLGIGLSTNYIYNPYREAGDHNNKGPESSRALRGNLPSGWSEKIVSNDRSVSYYTRGDLTISAKGNNADDFHYHYRQTLVSEGKVQLKAKVDRVRQNITALSKVGLRVSSGTNDSNPYVAVYKKPEGSVVFEYRTVQSGPITINQTGITNSSYKYFKMNRDGNNWYAYSSHNDIDWIYVGSATIDVGNMNVGVYLDPNTSTKRASVSFTDISYQQTPNFIAPSETAPDDEDEVEGPGSGGGPIGVNDEIPEMMRANSDDKDVIEAAAHEEEKINTMVYPNPGDGSGFNIILEKSLNREDIIISIYTMSGQKIYYRTYKNNYGRQLIEVSGITLNPGIYVVETLAGKEKTFNKIIVK